MHAVLVSMGTHGDVYPFLAVGTRLRARNHRVTLLANEHFGLAARDHGLEFEALVSNEDTQLLMGNPDVWHPLKSPVVGNRWMGRLLGGQYAMLAKFAAEKETILVANPCVFAARLAQEKFARPMASLMPMPWMVPTSINPAVLPPPLNLPGWAPPAAVRAYRRLLYAIANLMLRPHLNRARAAIGLPKRSEFILSGVSPNLNIGMFPEWYAAPESDWPINTRLAGFSMFDGGKGNGLPVELQKFCADPQPPIAFTFGTGMMHGRHLFEAAVETCRILGRRGILLTKFAEQVPSRLPEFVRHCSYAPFSGLFPKCAAVVHHGGVGTTAQALAAGLPQLILPMAWDQFDNAARVRRLGAGCSLRAGEKAAGQIVAGLRALLLPAVREQCQQIARRFGSEDALEKAAGWIEEIAPQSSPNF